MTGENNSEKTNQAMEAISIKQVKEWKKKNTCTVYEVRGITKTLFAEKIELNKIMERNYIWKK